MRIMIILLALFLLQAQEEKKAPVYGWKNSINANLNFTNSGYTNWTKGGENSTSWQGVIEYGFIENQELYNWNTNGRFAFGETKVGEKSEFRKTSDEIKFESVYTRKLGTHINPYAAVSVITQFTTTYNYDTDPAVKISTFFDPGYITQSFGVGYADEEIFKVRTGLSFKQTITNTYRSFSDDPKTTKIEDFKFETGLEIASSYNNNVSEKIVYEGKLHIFSALDAIKRVDVRFDNVFRSKISDFLTVSYSYTLLYDFDLSSQRQLKDVLAVGITYNLL